MSAPDNYSKIVLRSLHATPTTIILRPSPSPYHSWNRWPLAEEVLTGTIFGEGQNYQTEYETGTLSPGGGGGTTVSPFIG